MEALWIVRQFPRQILRDLHRFHGLNLADWWRGTRDENGDYVLGSYELLVYLEFMDEEGAFKTDAERAGRWPTWQQMLAEATNQAYRMHASYLTAHGVEGVTDTSEFEYRDPVDQKRHAEQQAADDADAIRGIAEFNAATGYS